MITAELLLEYTSDAVLVLDADFTIELANDRAAQLFRRPIKDLVGARLFQLFAELQGTGAVEQLNKARESRVPTRLELFFPSLFAWHSILAVPTDGRLVLFSRDVSDRVRRESTEAVKASVRRVIEDMPLCVSITRGKQHRVEMANANARALINGRDVEGELVERALPEARDQGFIDLLDQVFSSGKEFRGEEMPLRWSPNGDEEVKTGFFDLVYVPLFDDSGNVSGILHLGIDVTEKVNRRASIEQLAGERAAILEQLSEGVIVTDGHGNITFVNEAAEKMHGVKLLGVSPDDYSRAYRLLTDDGDRHPVETLPLTRAVRFKQVVSGATWKIQRPDASVLRVIGNAKPVLSSEGEVLACVLTFVPAHTP